MAQVGPGVARHGKPLGGDYRPLADGLSGADVSGWHDEVIITFHRGDSILGSCADHQCGWVGNWSHTEDVILVVRLHYGSSGRPPTERPLIRRPCLDQASLGKATLAMIDGNERVCRKTL